MIAHWFVYLYKLFLFLILTQNFLNFYCAHRGRILLIRSVDNDKYYYSLTNDLNLTFKKL